MTGASAEAVRVIRRRKRSLFLFTLAGFVVYHILLVAIPVARFGQLPNYLSLYNFPQAVQLIFAGTPALSDAFWILTEEPLFETGFMNPDFGIAEWSLILVPGKTGLAILLSALLGAFVILRRDHRHGSGLTTVSATVGASCLAMGSASLTWVVCCATPTWSVLLAFLGVSTSLALALTPFGGAIAALGVGLLLGATVLEGRRLTLADVPPARSAYARRERWGEQV